MQTNNYNFFRTAIFLTLLYFCNLLIADEVEIVRTVFNFNGSSWSVDVTLKHKDTGWKHYADAWRVVDAKGNEIAKRTLFHPHVEQQPFTRSKSGIKIPASTRVVYIEAHDTLHKWNPTKLKVDLVNNQFANVKINR